MSGMKSVNLGRLGEKKFSELCTQQGATCNTSAEDEHGWDYIVEADPSRQSMLPADLRDGIIRSLVQVKTTQSNKRVAKVKLSNALKAIQTDLPCFIVLLTYDHAELTGIYVRHFWTAEIERILKRAREAHRDKRDDLHKIELRFSLESFADVRSNLIEVLCSYFLEYGTNYGQEKKTIRDNIGYSETRAIGEFTFDEGVTARDIVDLQLSDDGQLSLSRFDLKDIRFDIPASTVDRPTEGSKISMRPTPKNGVLRIIKGIRNFELDAKIYLPGLVGPEHEDFKVQVKTSLFDMKLQVGKSRSLQAKVNLELDTVWDHYVASELASWDKNERVEFQIDCEAGSLFQGNFCPTLEANEWSGRIVAGGRLAVLFAGRQELVDLSPEHDRIWRQVSWLAKLEPVLGKLTKKLAFQMDKAVDAKCDHVLAFVVFELGDFFYGANVAFPVRHQNISGDQWELFFDDVDVLNTRRFKTDYANMRKIAQQEFSKLVEGRKKTSIFLGTGDLIDWFSTDQDRKSATFHRPD